jgi:hypothetical protein
MNRVKSIMLVAVMTVTLSSTAFGGTIIGARTTRTGTIVGARSGNIPGARTGNIAGTSVVTPPVTGETRSSFGILVTENIHSLIRLFIETGLF